MEKYIDGGGVILSWCIFDEVPREEYVDHEGQSKAEVYFFPLKA